MKSRLYVGEVEHRRFEPVHHEFRYKVCYYYLDLEEIERIFKIPVLFSCHFPGILSWSRKNYIHPTDKSIREVVTDSIKRQTGEDFSGPIRMLTNISYFGFCFNPVSFYYCFDQNENLKFIVSEVTNTPWKQRNIEVYPFRGDNKTLQQHAKSFHVSPFMQMEIDYTFVLNKPEEIIHILMQNRPTGKTNVIFDSTLKLKERPITAWNVFSCFMRFPFMTFTTVAGIYWQALLLYFIKKTPFHSHPDQKVRIGD
ncbi:MAG: DUF1365 domain-containing protein [Bacteriovoracaceae bacterium]